MKVLLILQSELLGGNLLGFIIIKSNNSLSQTLIKENLV